MPSKRQKYQVVERDREEIGHLDREISPEPLDQLN